jgi:hypothetical protein
MFKKSYQFKGNFYSTGIYSLNIGTIGLADSESTEFYNSALENQQWKHESLTTVER